MASPSVVATVAARLRAFAPFDALDEATCQRLAEATTVRYLEVGEVLFREGDEPPPRFYVLQKGLLELTRGDPPALLARLDDGDVFGVRAHLAGDRYRATATAVEDSLLYAVDRAELERLLAEAPAVARFFAAGFAADHASRGERDLTVAVGVSRSRSQRPPPHDEVTRVEGTREPLCCGPDETVTAAARRMAAIQVGSILVVDDGGLPLGILTDTDLRNDVVAAGVDPKSTPVSAVMSSPVFTITGQESASTLVSLMMRRKLRHFVVTRDGTRETRVTGVISEHDVLKAHGGHPTFLLNEMVHTTRVERLRELRDEVDALVARYLEAEVAMSFVSDIVTEINDVLIRRGVALSLDAMRERGRAPPAAFCWLSLGSEGREEQLLRTDLDNAILYRDVDAPRADEAAAFFLELGERVVEVLVAAGFERCRADMMASNPRWNLPLSRWRAQFERWIGKPESRALMHANVFFDLRPVDGDRRLAGELQSWVIDRTHEDRGFFPFFAKSATENPPPLGFFRNLMVERSGENRDAFDIKSRAMMPLADAARVLVYDLGIRMFGSTPQRWARVAEAEPGLRSLAEAAGTSYEILMRLRAKEGLRHGTSGRYVHIDELSKLERQTLRNTFDVVQDVQRMLRSRYRLDFIR